MVLQMRPEGGRTRGVGVAAGPGPTRRAVLGALAGAAVTLGVGRARGRIGSRGPGPVAFWAADRAGHRVAGLDADGLRRVSLEVPAPVGLRAPDPRRPPERWPVALVVVSACHGTRRGPRQDWYVDAEGGVVGAGPVEWASSPLERMADPPGWTVLTSAASGRTRLIRRGRRGVAFTLGIPFPAGAVAPAPGGLWLACARTGRTLRVSDTGRVLVETRASGSCGADAVLAASAGEGGGAWVACGGALLRFDREGRRMPGQGGFEHLVALLRPAPP